VIIFSVQRSKRGTGFVSFHLDKTKTPALSGEYIRNQAHGTYLSEFGKKFRYCLLRSIRWKIADEHFLQLCILISQEHIPPMPWSEVKQQITIGTGSPPDPMVGRCRIVSGRCYVGGLGAFCPILNLELYSLTFVQRFES